jgi:hypothetical protein
MGTRTTGQPEAAGSATKVALAFTKAAPASAGNKAPPFNNPTRPTRTSVGVAAPGGDGCTGPEGVAENVASLLPPAPPFQT